MRTDHTRLDLAPARPGAIARTRYRAPTLRESREQRALRSRLRSALGFAAPTSLSMAVGAALIVLGVIVGRWL